MRRSPPALVLLPSRDETPGPRGLTFQECSARAEWFRRETADVDFNPIDIDLNDNHVGVRKARRKMRIQIGRPHGSHFCDIIDDRRAAAQGDVPVPRGMLKG